MAGDQQQSVGGGLPDRLDTPSLDDYERKKIRAKKFSPRKHLNR